jgi:hypothetical protein
MSIASGERRGSRHWSGRKRRTVHAYFASVPFFLKQKNYESFQPEPPRQRADLGRFNLDVAEVPGGHFRQMRNLGALQVAYQCVFQEHTPPPGFAKGQRPRLFVRRIGT